MPCSRHDDASDESHVSCASAKSVDVELGGGKDGEGARERIRLYPFLDSPRECTKVPSIRATHVHQQRSEASPFSEG